MALNRSSSSEIFDTICDNGYDFHFVIASLVTNAIFFKVPARIQAKLLMLTSLVFNFL